MSAKHFTVPPYVHPGDGTKGNEKRRATAESELGPEKEKDITAYEDWHSYRVVFPVP